MPHLCMVMGMHKLYKIIENMELKGNWEEQKAKLKQKFADLTDNDLVFVKGKKEEMIKRIQSKLNITKKEFFKIIGEL